MGSDHVAQSILIWELKKLTEADIEDFGEYLRYIMVVLYQDELIISRQKFEANIAETPIGKLLDRMKKHHQKRLEFKNLEYIRNDPELARLRRDRKSTRLNSSH